MEDHLKINIRKLGIFMLIAAGIGLLHVPVNFVGDPLLRNKLLWCVLGIYTLYCFFVIIRGLAMVTWKQFLSRRVRCLLGFLWLIFYPALCLAWLALCLLLCYYTNPWHHWVSCNKILIAFTGWIYTNFAIYFHSFPTRSKWQCRLSNFCGKMPKFLVMPNLYFPPNGFMNT